MMTAEDDLALAKSQEKQGKDYFGGNAYREAAAAFSEAADHYQLSGKPLLATEMKNNQSVALLKNHQPREALLAARDTDRVFRLAGDPRKQAMSLANQAAAYQELKEFQQAEGMYLKAREIFLDLGEDEMQMQIAQSLSSLKLKQQDPLGAVFVMQQALEEIEQPTLRQRLLRSILSIPKALLGR
jgi:tetratricopeptide (TPR) repeat protein